MSSPLSLKTADLALRLLEADMMPSLGFSISIYFRYVDDILLGVTTENINHNLQMFNSYQIGLMFTLDHSFEQLYQFSGDYYNDYKQFFIHQLV